ncbi:MAG: Wzz/FepE/Etk N-terminal domain-containing protein [Bacteroidota bacterium]
MKKFNLLDILIKWKITLAMVAGIAILLSVIFSSPFFIKPKYKSTTVIYPSNLIPYGGESPTEQMLQLFQSDSIFKHVARRFNLIQHYELDSTSSTLQYDLLKEYNKNVSIKKTEYEAMEIEVLDQNPVMASNIIKEMIKVFNLNTLSLNREKSREMIMVYKEQLEKSKEQIDSTNMAIKEISVKYNIIDYASQSRELSREYYSLLGTGNTKKLSEITNALRALEENGGRFRELQQHLQNSTYEYGQIQIRYNTAVTDAKKYLTYTNVIVHPFPSDKKDYPVRWLIVTVVTCAALLLAISFIVLIEGKNNKPIENRK